MAGEAVSKLTDAAHQAVGEAKRSTNALAAEANQQVKGVLNGQVNAAADLVSQVAQTARMAAKDLDGSVPQLASLVRGASERMEEFSRDIRDRSVDELVQATSEFARRKPAVVFGAAVALGFLAFRLFKVASPGSLDGRRSGREGYRTGSQGDWSRDRSTRDLPATWKDIPQGAAVGRAYSDVSAPPIASQPGQFHDT
jgi:ElaB/YqjD/DUF883 family membrane-anchored ribosome-binding protein